MCQQDIGDVFEREKGKGLGKLIDASEASSFFFSCIGVCCPPLQLCMYTMNVESTSLIGGR